MSQPQQSRMEYIDRPELTETFIDNVRHVTFDGATVRVELAVTRFEEAPAGASATVARQYPASRLVLRPDAAVDLFVRLQRLIALMEQRGIVRRDPPKQEKATDALENPLGKGAKGDPAR